MQVHPVTSSGLTHPQQGWQRLSSSILIAVASLAGALTFLYPFFLPLFGDRRRQTGHGIEVSLLFAFLAGICLVVMLLEVQSRATGGGPAASKLVALLGVLVAVDAALRLIPSLLGASPIFFLIILAGYAYGADFGFLMGSLTLLVSAFITGGLGPWLSFQMLVAGWVGMTAGWLPKQRLRASRRRELAALIAFGALWGFLYGAIMNLYSWPFAAPGLQQQTGLYWVPGMGFLQTVDTYARFYLATSLVYDLFRAAANALLLGLLARPVVAMLDRYRTRFSWQPWSRLDGATEMIP
ncbi:MAG TPA: ECF transporter S component [Thermomicrobiaceae bacterium]|nr:ECF transporter S component [Thermomicrobiaceae bacterium]